MAYNVSIYGAPDWGRKEEEGYERRPTPFAVPAGGPVPNIGVSTANNTTFSLPAVTAAAQAKKLFQPRRGVLARHKLAYDLGFQLGQKSAAYPLQELTPGHDTVDNTLPTHAPTPPGIKAPRATWPVFGKAPRHKPVKQPARPRPAGEKYA